MTDLEKITGVTYKTLKKGYRAHLAETLLQAAPPAQSGFQLGDVNVGCLLLEYGGFREAVSASAS